MCQTQSCTSPANFRCTLCGMELCAICSVSKCPLCMVHRVELIEYKASMPNLRNLAGGDQDMTNPSFNIQNLPKIKEEKSDFSSPDPFAQNIPEQIEAIFENSSKVVSQYEDEDEELQYESDQEEDRGVDEIEDPEEQAKAQKRLKELFAGLGAIVKEKLNENPNASLGEIYDFVIDYEEKH